MLTAFKLQPSPLRDAAVVLAIAALVASLGLGISNLAAEWGAQPEEILGRLSRTPLQHRPPNRWVIAGMREHPKLQIQTDALGAASIYLHGPGGSLENGASALIQYFVMRNDDVARRAWEDSIADMGTETLWPRKQFRLKDLAYPHLCVDEPRPNAAYCRALVGAVWFEAYDRSGGACDCAIWLTKAGARHLENIKDSIGWWWTTALPVMQVWGDWRPRGLVRMNRWWA